MNGSLLTLLETQIFPQLLQEDPNFDLITFITEKLPFLITNSFSALK